METDGIDSAVDQAWLDHREARAALDDAEWSLSQSSGIGKVLGKISVHRAERRVEDTGEHLDMAEEIQMYVARRDTTEQ